MFANCLRQTVHCLKFSNCLHNMWTSVHVLMLALTTALSWKWLIHSRTSLLFFQTDVNLLENICAGKFCVRLVEEMAYDIVFLCSELCCAGMSFSPLILAFRIVNLMLFNFEELVLFVWFYCSIEFVHVIEFFVCGTTPTELSTIWHVIRQCWQCISVVCISIYISHVNHQSIEAFTHWSQLSILSCRSCQKTTC